MILDLGTRSPHELGVAQGGASSSRRRCEWIGSFTVPRCEMAVDGAQGFPQSSPEAPDGARVQLESLLGLLWRVMLKQGVPPKLVRLLAAMHKTVLVKFGGDGYTFRPS
jgi:hypothetical protein